MRNIMGAALATGFLLAGVGFAAADDTVRLGGLSAQAAIQGGTDTELVRGRGHGYYGGGYGRSYYGGGYGRGYYGGGYYPRSYAYYAPSYYYPRTYCAPSYYYPTYYYRPVSSYYYPMAGESIPTPITQTNVYYSTPVQQPYGTQLPPNGSTFPYDGGPPSLVPMPGPGKDINPASKPGIVIPKDGKLVSLPTQATGGTTQVGIPQRVNTPRVNFPAYGEEPIVPVPRKTPR